MKTKNHIMINTLALSFLLCLVSSFPAAAEDTGKFDFYYQRIEKIVPLETIKNPSSPWEYAKQYAQKAWNFTRRIFEGAVSRNFTPGQGSKLWYSKKDPSMAYQMNRVKVTSEKHLLELMGATNGDEKLLNNGQKALLALYRNANQAALKGLSKKALSPRIVVHLTDTTGFEDGSKYPNVTPDFWPESRFFSITMPAKRYAYAGSEEDAVGTFVHETAHCTNLTLPEIIKPYGLDGVHYASEMTKPRMAFQEAWSEYQESIHNPAEAKSIESSAKRIMIESTKNPGDYDYYDVTDPAIKGIDLLKVESCNAYMMLRLSKELSDGQNKVQTAFFKGNLPWRNMEGFIKGFAKLYPQDVTTLAKIVDEVTAKKLSNSELQKIIGPSAALNQYLSSRQITVATAQTENAEAPTAPPTTVADSPTPTGSNQEMQKQYEATYKQYIEATKTGSKELAQKAAQKLKAIWASMKNLGGAKTAD